MDTPGSLPPPQVYVTCSVWLPCVAQWSVSPESLQGGEAARHELMRKCERALRPEVQLTARWMDLRFASPNRQLWR